MNTNNLGEHGLPTSNLGNKLQRRDLLKEWWNKNEQLLFNIVGKYHPQSTAEEFVQEVAVLVHKKLPDSIDNEAKFRKWTVTVLKRIIIDWWRKNKKMSKFSFVPLDDTLELPDVSNQEQSVFLGQVLSNIDKLPKMQKIIMMKIVETEKQGTRKSLKEISKELNIPVRTLRSNLRHARENLKKLLKMEGDIYE